MAITARVGLPITNRWCKGRCTGFRHHQSNNVLGYFKIFETDEIVTCLFGKITNIELPRLNELRRACGLGEISKVHEVEFPEVGDDNMMGYDTIIEVYSKQDGKYTNAVNFRKYQDEQQPSTAAHNDEPF